MKNLKSVYLLVSILASCSVANHDVNSPSPSTSVLKDSTTNPTPEPTPTPAPTLEPTQTPAPKPVMPAYAGCKENDFVTVRDPELVIGIQGLNYEPRCAKIRKGTKVTVPAMRWHPLGAGPDFDSIVNPFRPASREFITDQTRVMEQAGFFGFYCANHGEAQTGEGMGGLIWVVE